MRFRIKYVKLVLIWWWFSVDFIAVSAYFSPQNEVQKQFDQNADEFTLEKIIEFGFDQFAEQIGDISGAATQELKIEQVLYMALPLMPLEVFVLRTSNLGIQALKLNHIFIWYLFEGCYFGAIVRNVKIAKIKCL